MQWYIFTSYTLESETMDFYEFKASLVDVVNSMPGGATQGDLVSKTKQNKN